MFWRAVPIATQGWHFLPSMQFMQCMLANLGKFVFNFSQCVTRGRAQSSSYRIVATDAEIRHTAFQTGYPGLVQLLVSVINQNVSV